MIQTVQRDSGSLKEFKKELKKMWDTEGSESIVPATFLAIAIADCIPHLGDVMYFYSDKWLVDNKPKLKPQAYSVMKTINYYGWDVAWYLSLFAVSFYGGKNIREKFKLVAAVMGAGFIAHYIWKSHMKNKPLVWTNVKQLEPIFKSLEPVSKAFTKAVFKPEFISKNGMSSLSPTFLSPSYPVYRYVGPYTRDF